MVKIIEGNIFTTKCKTIVNTVNCVGVMGTGIAYEFRLRYPEMYEKYKDICEKKLLNIGKLWIYKTNDKWILNFPTKYHWKDPSKEEYLRKGLSKFVEKYKEKGIKSIAFPLLGASNGGIPPTKSLDIMLEYLEPLDDIEIEIYKFNPLSQDDLYLQFKSIFNSLDIETLAKRSGLRRDFVKKVKKALQDENINRLSALLSVKGIGHITLEKSFKFIMEYKNRDKTNKLFD